MKRSLTTRSYNDLLQMIQTKMEDEQKASSLHSGEKDANFDDSWPSDQDQSQFADLSASNIPKNLLCALADESFARCSSFMGQSGDKLSIGPDVEAIDIERKKTKMESFDCYILVSVLTATASFSTLQDFTRLDDSGKSFYCQVLLVITQIAAGLSTICGLYATVVFSLTVLYAKSALGLNRDATYTYFLKETGMVRVRGFRAFSTSLLAFALEAALVTFLRVPAFARFPVLIVIVVLLRFLGNDWLLIVDTASAIYTGNIPKEETKE